MFIGRISDKRGYKLFQGTPQETREYAALVCFRDYKGPAKVVSVCNAYRDPRGNWQPNGSDTRWYKRGEVWRDPAPACDVGLFGDAAKQIDLTDLL